MLVFATEFPTARGRSTNDFLRVAKEWLTGSPHNSWSEIDFSEELPNTLTNYSKSDQEVEVGLLDNSHGRYAGFRYQWVEDVGREWVTELVAKQQGNRLWVSVRLFCTFSAPRLSLPTPRKPFVIKKILADLGGGNDSGFVVSDEPIELADENIWEAAQAIQGTLGNVLPIVYVSRDFNDQLRMDIAHLAEALSGLAHVLVEPSRTFSVKLMHEVGGNNAYGGAIGIYWPNGAGTHHRLLADNKRTSRLLTEDIINRVRLALCAMRASPDCTWAFLNELISQGRIEALKSAGSTAVREYIDAFDAELRAKETRIREAEEEIKRLREEVKGLETSRLGVHEGILRFGKEQDFYEGEIQTVVLRMLRESLNRTDENSRSRHILIDLLSANEESGVRERLIVEVKHCLSTAARLGSRELSTLRDIGFVVADGGKHYKSMFRGDGRYTFSMSKTGSDHRAGKNLASEIIAKLFR